MPDIKDFNRKGKASRYLHASHIICFLQPTVFQDIEFSEYSSFQKYQGQHYALPADLKSARHFVHFALVNPSTAQMFNLAFQEVAGKIKGHENLDTEVDRETNALLNCKLMNLWDDFNCAIQSSLRGQLPFLKEMCIEDNDFARLQSSKVAYGYLTKQIEQFKSLNGGSEWVAVRQDPNIVNIAIERLRQRGWSFASLQSNDSGTVVHQLFAKGGPNPS